MFRNVVSLPLLLTFMFALPKAEMRLFPAPSGPDVPVDAPLRIVFDQTETPTQSGLLTVYEAGTGKAVFVLDIARIPKVAAGTGWPFQRTVGGENLNILPLVMLEKEAYIALPPHTLASGRSYYVTLDAGVFKDANGLANPAVSGASAWRFSTRSLPAAARSGYSVAADGSGDFCTLQGALDFLPAGNQNAVTLSIKPGSYPELVRSIGKNRISVVGTDRKSCLITYANNNAFNAGTSQRAMARIFGDDIRLENITFANATPQGGSQAEALFIRGERCVVSHCAFISFQDTMLLDGRVYLIGCEVTGAVDYIWGYGIAFFQSCTLKSNADGYILQARNPKDSGGYVFIDCTLLASGNTKNSYLARDGNGQFPDGQAIWIDTHMGAHIPKTGWLLQGAGGSNPGFAEYHSLDLAEKPIDVGGRSQFSRQLTAVEADFFRNPVHVLGGTDNWDPRPTTSSAYRAKVNRRVSATSPVQYLSASKYNILGDFIGN